MKKPEISEINIKEKLLELQNNNLKYLSCVRNIPEIKKYFRQLSKLSLIDSYDTISLKYNEILILSKLFCKSVLTYFNKYGCLSRGSYILIDSDDLKINLNKIKIHKKQEDCKLSVQLKNKIIKTKFIKVNPVPDNREKWFEKVWKNFEND